MYHQNTPSFGQEILNAQSEQITIQQPTINPRRQVSLLYGVQFNSQVPLFQRTYSTIQSCGLNLFSQDDIHRKVLSFLKAATQNTPEMVTLFKNFKQLQGQMGLLISRSKKTLSQSSNNASQQSIENSDKDIHVMKDFSNRVIIKQLKWQGQTINKNRGSMMKSNRISIADAIKITQISELKHIVPLQSIDSSSSVSSTQSTQSNQQNTKNNRCFQILSLSSTGDNSDNKAEQFNKVKEKNKKVSIMSFDLDNSQFQSQIFSQDGQPLSLTNIKTPQLPFDLALIQAIFDSPCPFLVNLSLCLLCKCAAKSQIFLNQSNVGWMLTISTVVAYKIYYDEPISGLMQFYASFLGIKSDEVAHLERWFLQRVGYQVVVSNSQYQSVLFQLISR